MTPRCLICKGFVRRMRSTHCKRCGAWNVDTSLAAPPLPPLFSGHYPAYTTTTSDPMRFAYRQGTA